MPQNHNLNPNTPGKHPSPPGSQERFSLLGGGTKGMKTGAVAASAARKRRPRRRHHLEASATKRINPLDVLMRIDRNQAQRRFQPSCRDGTLTEPFADWDGEILQPKGGRSQERSLRSDAARTTAGAGNSQGPRRYGETRLEEERRKRNSFFIQKRYINGSKPTTWYH